jgi:3-methyl-2-oxobutanoate hydroxymethyltransferase
LALVLVLTFSHDFLADSGHIPAAISRYVEAVKNGEFPTAEQQY